MQNNKPQLFPIFLSLFLALAAMVMTVVLPGLFVTDQSARPVTWNASIVIACAIEALIALYAALPFFPRFRTKMSMTVYPSIAFVLLPYALAVVLTLFFIARHIALYATLLSVETLLTILVVCSIAVIGTTRRSVENERTVEQTAVFKPALRISSARNALQTVKNKGSEAVFKSCADAMRLLEERAASATRFGRPGSESAEAEIEASISALVAQISDMASLAAATDVDVALAACTSAARQIGKTFDLRERQLVR